MQKISPLLALAGVFVVSSAPAISLDDIPLWTGSGTNRAALVIEWNSPEVFNDTTVPAPVANKTMVWGYRFNGSATGTQMFNAIVAANPRLYAVENVDPTYGTGVDAIGFCLTASRPAGVTDGTVTDLAGAFTNGVLIDPNLSVDGAAALPGGDLFWSGHYGPNWQFWTEQNDQGGFVNSPNRGSSPFYDPNTYNQGQWSFASYGLDDLVLTNGSWLGFSVAAAAYTGDPTDPAYNAYNNDEQAPPSPDGTYVAYVCNTNDFAVQIVSTNNLAAASLYSNPIAMLNRPTLQFLDPYDGSATNHRVKIIDPPFNVAPDGSKVITEILNGGQVTVKLGRKIYDDPNNPYGVDFIVYGNSFFSAFGTSGSASDATDLNAATLSSGYNGHAAVVSVSQDGINWYTYSATPALFPDNAWRWDDTNDAWTAEETNPTKPVNPAVAAQNFSGLTVADGVDQFTGASGGTGYALAGSGLPWIQYVRIQPAPGAYTVIDAIAAVNPAVVGDALSLTPANLTAGVTNLVFQDPAASGQNLVTLNFAALSGFARVSPVTLNNFPGEASVVGTVSSAYQIAVQPLPGASPVTWLANASLRTAPAYSGNGGDLRVDQWAGTNWISLPCTYNPASRAVLVSGLTNFSALVVSQIIPPVLSIQNLTNQVAFQFTPVPNAPHTLQRSTDLVHWTSVATVTPTNAVPVSVLDNTPPAGKAFYRLSVNVP